MGNPKEYVNAAGLAKVWPDLFNPQTLAAWRADGNGPPYKRIGSRYFYEVSEVADWIEAQSVEQGGR